MAQWSVPFDKIAKKIGGDLLDVVKESSLFIFSRIILLSPVDTGRFRANWICSLDQPIDATREEEDKSGSITIERADKVISSMLISQKVFLVNNLPYAYRLEHGWSQQAPRGMVEVAAQDFQGTVKRILKRK
jgi:hypothetical protein